MTNQSASRNHLEYMLSREERQKSNPPIPNTWPLFGGAAVWASLLMEKLNREIEAIEGKDFEAYKKNPIFVRQTNAHMLKSNFEPALLRLFNEVHFWQKLPTVAQIPSSVVDFVEAQEAELLLAQQPVLLVGREYNDILLSLPVQFADIFRIHLKRLDVMITCPSPASHSSSSTLVLATDSTTILAGQKTEWNPAIQDLRKFEQEYKAIMVAFQLDKDPQDAFYETYTEFPNLQAFENDINIWKERERQIVAKEPSQNIEIVRVDVVPLKDALIAHCKQRQELLERCSDILPIPDQETMLLLQLPSKFQASKQFIAQQDVRMVDLKATKKKELQASLDQLASNITATRKRFLAQAPFQDRAAVDDANGIIGEFRDDFKTHRAEEMRLLVGIELFGLEQRVYDDLTATTKDLDDLSFLWGQKAEWQRLRDQWKTGQFNDLNAKGMDDAACHFTTDLLKRKTDCGPIEVWKALKTQVDSFKQSLPLITYLRNDDMRERHWEKLKEETQPFDKKSADFTVEKVFEIGLNEHLGLIQSIAGQAPEEAVIDKKIREVEQTWNEMEYIVSPYKQVARIGSTEDIEQHIDDHLMELASMKSSGNVAFFVQDLDKWEKLLTAMQATTEKLMLVQKEWLYLESIFGASEDMRRQMAKEAREFNNINNEWEKIMKAVMADRHVLPTAQIAGIVQRCVDIQKKLETIKNNLNKFLEDKRMLFPRFYFLSDDDLLKILGYARGPQAARPHLKKCYASLNNLHFASERKATKMFLLEGEEITLVRPLTTSGAVEAWLSELETIMQETVRAEILHCYEDIAPDQEGHQTAPHPTIEDHVREVLPNLAYSKVKDVNDCLWKQQLKVTRRSVTVNETDFIQMPLVLFEDAMRHVCRISRTISRQLVHTMFVGVGGSGRESLARLVTRNFHLPHFLDCLKDLYRKTPDLLSNLFIHSLYSNLLPRAVSVKLDERRQKVMLRTTEDEELMRLLFFPLTSHMISEVQFTDTECVG
ncbi:putative Dynein axonemal heavy chain 2 [Blattamonas nauphoetae]|uniref:Dynein axonemal heavy chain 2 n=1 Tax=Blattamonas nauphoetae TaxID=2049346 RepID=A0ABQ9XKP7_9EUKA|nr:putative Dynein axonemal heavy chain 2 [Blattamonas nauphoetae]